MRKAEPAPKIDSGKVAPPPSGPSFEDTLRLQPVPRIEPPRIEPAGIEAKREPPPVQTPRSEMAKAEVPKPFGFVPPGVDAAKAEVKRELPAPHAARPESPTREAMVRGEAPRVSAPSRGSQPKVEAPKVQAPKVEAPKVQAPKVQAPKVQAPKVQAPKVEAARPAAPSLDWGSADEDDQALLDDLDAGFYMIVQGKSEQPSAEAQAAQSMKDEARGERPEDVAAVRQMFEQLAPFYAKPIRDFLIESAWGDPPKTWLAITTPAARSLKQAAEKMSIPELGAALEEFVAALELAESAPGAHVTKDAKELIAGSYERLVAVMPSVFALEKERSVREPIIVHALLQQVPGMGKVSLDRLYAAGLSQLEMFYSAKPGDISVLGVPLSVAIAVCERFRAYRDEMQGTRPDEQRHAERQKLEDLARQMRGLNQTFKGAASSWSAQALKDKRWLRTERERLFLEMTVVLARIGEVDLLRRLERLPFERKVAELETFLTENKGGGTAPF